MQALNRTLLRLAVALLVIAALIGCSAEARKSRLLEKANGYYRAGEYDKAKVEYLNVLREDSRNATAIQRLGHIWLEQGAPLQAAPYLLATRQLMPQDLNSRTKLVSVFLYARQLEEARKEILAILDQSPTDQEALRLLVETSSKKPDLDDAERRLNNLGESEQPGVHFAKVALLLRKGDLGAAEIEARRGISLAPDSAEAHFALARVLLAKKDLIGAEGEFKAAAELAPARSPIRLAHAEFALRRGQVDEAVRLLNEITREAPDSLPAWRLLAQIAFSQKKLDESQRLLDNVLLRDPANVEGRMLRAQVWLAQGETSRAIEALEALDMSYPKASPVKYQLARAYLQDNNPAQAAFVLRQAVARNPDYVEAILLLGEINLRENGAQQVVATMLELVKRQPNLIQAQLLLAQGYQSLGRLQDAAVVFRDLIKTDPQNASAYLSLALVLKQQGKVDEARAAIESAQKLAPKSPMIVSQLIDLDIQVKDFETALRRVHDLRIASDSPDLHFLEGKIYAAQGRWDDAERALLEALDRQPAHPNAFNLLLSTYLVAGKFPQAVALLESELSKNPNDPRALISVAVIYEKTQDYSKARTAYEKLLSLKPEEAPALNNLAYLYAEHFGLLDKAAELAQKARASQPDDPRIADTLGWILCKQGRYQQALALFQESARKLPGNPEVQFHLGMAHYMMGQSESARQAFLMATAAPKDFPGKEDAQRKLSILGSGEGEPVELSIKDLEATLERQPNDPVAQIRLAESYEKAGAFLKAAASYESAIKLNPSLLTATIKLAELYSGPLQANDKALQFASQARELAPNDPKVLAILGKAAYQSGNFQWAYSLLQESARQLANDDEVLYDLAWAAYSLGLVEKAWQTMQSLLVTAPGSERAKDARLFVDMTALSPRSDVSRAGQLDAEGVLQKDPSYVPALVAKATLLERRGDSNAAIKIYRDVLSRFPDFAPAQKRLALLYETTLEKRGEAYDLARKARKTLPNDPELAKFLAKLSYERSEFAYAAQLLKQSAEKGPLDPEDLYYLGMAQFKSNDIVQARQALDQALAAGLSDPLASEARRTMKSLDQSN